MRGFRVRLGAVGRVAAVLRSSVQFWVALCCAIALALGLGAAPAGAVVDPGPGSSEIAFGSLLVAGTHATCATDVTERRIYCWGDYLTKSVSPGGHWEGAHAARPMLVPGMEPVADAEPVTAMSVMQLRGCLVQGGRVRCWGLHWSDGGGVEYATTYPVTVPGITDAVGVAVTERQKCALLRSGSVTCWGYTEDSWQSPVVLEGLSDVKVIEGGDGAICAVTRSGQVLCWGQEYGDGHSLLESGVLGRGNIGYGWYPEPLPVGANGVSITDAVDVSVKTNAACALRRDRTSVCWGANGWLSSALKIFGPWNPYPFAPTQELAGVQSLSAGGAQCAVVVDHTVKCWGSSAYGNLGIGVNNIVTPIPVTVHGIDDALSVAGGVNHMCARRVTKISCWGRLGQVNDEAGPNYLEPIDIDGHVGPAADGVIDTEGPLGQLRTSKDLRCGRGLQGDSNDPGWVEQDRCGFWLGVFGGEDGGSRTLFGPDEGEMAPVWGRGQTAWRPVSQTESGSGTTSDPWRITTEVRGGDEVRVEQRDSYVDGESQTRTEVQITNTSDEIQYYAGYVAADCQHDDEVSGLKTTLGYGWRSFEDAEHAASADRAGCASRLYDGRYFAIDPDFDDASALRSSRWSIGSPHRIASQIRPLDDRVGFNLFDDECDCGPRIDDAVGAGFQDVMIDPGETITVRYVMEVGNTNDEGLVDFGNGEQGIVPWNIEAIGARAAWLSGLDGKGRSIGVVDTGVNDADPLVGVVPRAEYCSSTPLPAATPFLVMASCNDEIRSSRLNAVTKTNIAAGFSRGGYAVDDVRVPTAESPIEVYDPMRKLPAGSPQDALEEIDTTVKRGMKVRVPVKDVFLTHAKSGQSSGRNSAQPYGLFCAGLEIDPISLIPRAGEAQSLVGIIPYIGPKLTTWDDFDVSSCQSHKAGYGFYQGTRVAGASAGREQSADANHPARRMSVAPFADIVAANVSSRRQSYPSYLQGTKVPGPGGLGTGVMWMQDWEYEYPYAMSADIARGLKFMRAQAATGPRIAVVNLMQPNRLYAGDDTGYSSETCEGTSPAVEAEIKRLNSMKIPVVVGSGGTGKTNEMSWPACLPGVISVGAVNRDMKVIASSNSSSQLTVLAPGAKIPAAHREASLLNFGNEAADYPGTEATGTYLAAAHVSGAIALYKQKYPNATPAQIKTALQQSPTVITDQRTSRQTPFLRVDALLQIKPGS